MTTDKLDEVLDTLATRLPSNSNGEITAQVLRNALIEALNGISSKLLESVTVDYVDKDNTATSDKLLGKDSPTDLVVAFPGATVQDTVVPRGMIQMGGNQVPVPAQHLNVIYITQENFTTYCTQQIPVNNLVDSDEIAYVLKIPENTDVVVFPSTGEDDLVDYTGDSPVANNGGQVCICRILADNNSAMEGKVLRLMGRFTLMGMTGSVPGKISELGGMYVNSPTHSSSQVYYNNPSTARDGAYEELISVKTHKGYTQWFTRFY